MVGLCVLIYCQMRCFSLFMRPRLGALFLTYLCLFLFAFLRSLLSLLFVFLLCHHLSFFSVFCLCFVVLCYCVSFYLQSFSKPYAFYLVSALLCQPTFLLGLLLIAASRKSSACQTRSEAHTLELQSHNVYSLPPEKKNPSQTIAFQRKQSLTKNDMKLTKQCTQHTTSNHN